MKSVTLFADWEPKPEFQPGPKDVDGKLSYLGSKVWRNPRLEVVEKDVPTPGPDEVVLEVKACGICGSDVHMAQAAADGYIFYPGLTAFPCTLGHEFAGVVVASGENAINKRTGRRFAAGEPVCAEEMFWCAACRPCADGYPNQCERLQEIGFSCDGAFAEYVKVSSRYCWSLKELEPLYGDRLFLAGSLVEPTSVAYTAVIERAGGIRPGDNVVILGGGPIGLAAVAILKRAGAAHVILSEPSEGRAKMGLEMGATEVINPLSEDFAGRVLEITGGLGAKLYLEATGLPHRVIPDIEKAIWNGKMIDATISLVARADARIPINGEVYQVRHAQIVGSQGHSGDGTFPRVISAMASGMDMTKLITKQVPLEQIPENIILLQTDRTNCKITMVR